MSLKFICDNCGNEIISQFLNIGEKVRCPECKNEVIIPEKASEVNTQSSIIPTRINSEGSIKKPGKTYIVRQSENEYFSYPVLFKILLFSFFLSIFVSLIILPILRAFGISSDSSETYLFYTIISGLSFIYAIYFYTSVRFRKGLFSRMLAFRKVGWKPYVLAFILTGFLLSLVFIMPSDGIPVNERDMFFDKIIENSHGFIRGEFVFAFILVFGAIFEELIFRGYLFSFFTLKYNRKTAFIIIGVLFALGHISISGPNYWWGILHITASGFIDTFYRYRFRSVFPGMLAHVMNNGVIGIVVILEGFGFIS
jgi:membrane protease YdiL (CAAX protease family)/DNA-directed RNA polymerase subunit RPC12/RpoP